MYGMVNRALQDMLVEEYGEPLWNRVRDEAGVDVEVFVSNEGYPDRVTYDLVGAAARATGRDPGELLRAFGAHWVLRTARDSYGDLLEAGGSNLREFLVNLPNFHTRISLMFPHLEPPVFACSEVGPQSLRLHYHSTREGLAPFVLGLLDGLARMFAVDIAVRHDVARAAAGHDEFVVSWAEAPPP